MGISVASLVFFCSESEGLLSIGNYFFQRSIAHRHSLVQLFLHLVPTKCAFSSAPILKERAMASKRCIKYAKLSKRQFPQEVCLSLPIHFFVVLKIVQWDYLSTVCIKYSLNCLIPSRKFSKHDTNTFDVFLVCNVL